MNYLILAALGGFALLGLVHYFNRRKLAALQAENRLLKNDADLSYHEAKRASLKEGLSDAEKTQAEKIREFRDRIDAINGDDESRR
jgi:hypothetical protein